MQQEAPVQERLPLGDESQRGPHRRPHHGSGRGAHPAAHHRCPGRPHRRPGDDAGAHPQQRRLRRRRPRLPAHCPERGRQLHLPHQLAPPQAGRLGLQRALPRAGRRGADGRRGGPVRRGAHPPVAGRLHRLPGLRHQRDLHAAAAARDGARGLRGLRVRLPVRGQPELRAGLGRRRRGQRLQRPEPGAGDGPVRRGRLRAARERPAAGVQPGGRGLRGAHHRGAGHLLGGGRERRRARALLPGRGGPLWGGVPVRHH
mmetsp:Transcript_33138/g.54074  ORF Transcript_33138/g.54074 Transcript_33138/m.54074 type:complete len:258 (-) Transcript_33138:804-1577(-)